MYLLYAASAVVIVAVTVVMLSRHIAERAQEVMDVNDWFSEQMLIYPPKPLSPPYVAVVKSIMEDDSDLWRYLGCDQDAVERERCCRQAVDFGRYLHVFGPIGLYESRYCPSLYYGVFDADGVLLFRVWIEFRYQNETVWVLTEDGMPRITRFSDFRVNHPGLTQRRPIYFVHEGLDANVNLESDPDFDR